MIDAPDLLSKRRSLLLEAGGRSALLNDRWILPSRRECALGLLALTLGGARGGTDELAAIETASGGRLGVFALDLATGRTLARRADERFPLQSVFKLPLAALALADAERGRISMGELVPLGISDLLPASPMATAALPRGSMTVEELCAAVLLRSDNTAANLLMARLGGPRRVTRFLRSIGDRETRVDDYEVQLGAAGLDADTTTPRAMTATLRMLLFGDVLGKRSRSRLETWMEGNLVGRSRLRAAFPPDWRSGDRTGTAEGVCNDCTVALRPGRAPLLVSAFYEASGVSTEAQEAVLRRLGRCVSAWQFR